jgi:ABC-2 type transport system ATP-binding protein
MQTRASKEEQSFGSPRPTSSASTTASEPESKLSPTSIDSRRDSLRLVEPSGRPKVVLHVHDLRKHYGTTEAVRGVSFDLRQGEIFGLLGLNGAGKTTLISMLAGLRRPSGGDALLLGHSLCKDAQAMRHLIGVAPQEDALYPMLTAAENLRFFGRLYDVTGARLEDRIAQLLQFVGLKERANDLAGNYSGGMKRRLNLAAALVHEPELILLDEPTSGVDPESREEILSLVRSLRAEGKSIIYTTHYMEEAQDLCDELSILEKGKIVAMGTLDAMLRKVDFSEIIELRGLSPQVDLSAISKLPGIGHIEHVDSMARLYVNHATDYLDPLQKIMSLERSANLKITPVTLENLFLHLTGRKAHAGRKIYE